MQGLNYVVCHILSQKLSLRPKQLGALEYYRCISGNWLQTDCKLFFLEL